MPPTLALHGGSPSLPDAPFAWPPPDTEVRDALLAAWAAGSWGHYHGHYGEHLARLLADYHQIGHVWLCSSGTVAVELALRGLKVGPGEEVILAGYDFAGNFRAVEAVGAWPVLVDIDPNSWCLDIHGLDAAHTPASRAIIVSHLHGGLADMQRLMNWARQRNVPVIEDACQAPGATVGGRRAAHWGDVGVLSFGGSKLLTAGRGGALLTPHAEVLQRVKIHAQRGNNAFPLSELQAAVLPPQLAKLDERNRLRRARVDQLLLETADLAALTPVSGAGPLDEPTYYKLAWRYDASALRDLPIEVLLECASGGRCAPGSRVPWIRRSQQPPLPARRSACRESCRGRDHLGVAPSRPARIAGGHRAPGGRIEKGEHRAGPLTVRQGTPPLARPKPGHKKKEPQDSLSIT